MIGPGRRRIRRIRWTTTIVFALTTAACMLVVVGFALRIDSDSRAGAIDSDLRQRASTLSDIVSFSKDHNLQLENVNGSQAAQDVPVLGFVTTTSIVYAKPGQQALPSDTELRSVLQRLQVHGNPYSFTARNADEHEMHWAAAGIDDLSVITDSGFIQGFVIVGSTVPGASQHAALRSGLLLVSGVLVVLAAALGHVLSGWAMRPALRGFEAQEQFLLEASHELRTPLSVLRVVLDRARLAAPPSPGSHLRNALDRAVRQVERMDALTDGLLMRARASIGATSLLLEPLRLDQVVETTVSELPDAEDVDTVTEPIVVDGDVELLAQAIRNLIGNAQKHGAPPIRIVVDAAGISVTDHGQGIRPRRRRAALRSGSTSGAGTGTGLAIVAWVAKVHHGSVRLDDAPGGGLLVRLTFPPSAGASPGQSGTASSTPHDARRNVEVTREKGRNG